jgi:hypothetical protein
MLHAASARCHLAFGHALAGSTEKAMTSSLRRANLPDDPDLARRRFLEHVAVATATAAVLWPGDRPQP